jgi:hypothetical protein
VQDPQETPGHASIGLLFEMNNPLEAFDFWRDDARRHETGQRSLF